MVVGKDSEPSKSMTADLQSAPFGRSGTPPGVKTHCRLFSKMNGGGGRDNSSLSLLALRAVACGNVLSLALESNLSRRFLPFPLSANIVYACRGNHITVVNNGGGEGFEPSKSMTADLQSAPFGRSGTPPRGNTWYWPASFSGSGAHHTK